MAAIGGPPAQVLGLVFLALWLHGCCTECEECMEPVPPLERVVWGIGAGDDANQQGRNLATDGAGNLYLIGTFAGSLDLGGGVLTAVDGLDVVVASFDSDGNHRWSASYGGDGLDFGLGIATDAAGDVLVTGYFSNSLNVGLGTLTSAGQQDVFLAKFRGDGTPVWSNRYGSGGNNQQAFAVATDPAGNVYLTGHYRETIDFGGGDLPLASDWNVFLASFESGGGHRWSQGFGGDSDQAFARTVAVSDDGSRVAIAGPFFGTINFGGGDLVSAGDSDGFVASFDSAGVHSFSNRFGDETAQLGRQVAFSPTGSLYLAGYLQGTSDLGCGSVVSAGGFDVVLAEFGPTGACLQSQRFGDTGDQFVDAIAVNSAGRIVIGGQSEGELDFGLGPMASAQRDAYVAKLDDGFSALWQQRFLSAGDQRVERIAVAGDDVYATGVFENRLELGVTSLTSGGGTDLWLARLRP